MFYRNYLAWDD